MALLWQRLSLAMAVVAGLMFSQAPDYLGRYRQRLGAAIDQASAENAAFDAYCGKAGLTRDQGIGQLLGNSDPLVRERGFRLRQAPARLMELRQQADDFASSQPVIQMTGFVMHFDREVARGAYDDFTPVGPPPYEGLISGGAAFVLSLAILRLIVLPFHRRGEAVGKTPAQSIPAAI